MVTKDTGIIEAVQNHPEIMEVFAEYGLGCIGCMAAHFETIGQGAGAHGIDVDALIEDINKVIAEAEKAAQGYVDGTMEYDGFQYDGAAIYNQQGN